MRDDGTSEWADKLGACFSCGPNDYAEDDPWKASNQLDQDIEAAAFKDAESIIFVHADNDTERGQWVCAAATWITGFVVFVSRPGGLASNVVATAFTAAGANGAAARGRVFACYWGVADFSTPLKDEVQNLINAIGTGDSEWHKWLQPRACPENLLSWALIEKYGKGANNGADITADATLVDAATSELRQRRANATLTLEEAQKVIEEFRADS